MEHIALHNGERCSPLRRERVENILMRKTKEEIEKLRHASMLTDKGFAYICKTIQSGMTEKEIAKKLDDYMFSQGATGLAFDTIVGSGKNSAQIHSTPSDRVIQENDIILLDFGYVIDGYCSDMSRTIFVGSITEKQKEFYDLVYRTQMNAIENIKIGMTAKEADILGRKLILDKGMDYAHALGHGIGTEVHEELILSPKRDTVLEEDMVFTIEPGIYLENEFGIRIEDVVLLTKHGVETLSNAPKEIIVIK